MLFNSYRFLFVFLPIVLGTSFFLRGRRLLVWLTLTSYVFYALGGLPLYLAPMIAITFLDFALAQMMENQIGVRRRLILFLSLSINLSLFAYLKYTPLILRSGLEILGLSHQLTADSTLAPWLGLIVPAGISFYTFQTISYMVDVYRGAPAERDFWRFACFIAFFPHLIAGPLTRHNQLIPQLAGIGQNGIAFRLPQGLFLLCIGLLKKALIADRIGQIIDPWLLDPLQLTCFQGWLCMIGYGLQLYFDFSGYSDMAIGMARLFGIELPQNFNNPYISTNPSDFWRRWHMTLSQWLRDYLYIPLGGNRERSTVIRNLFVTMLLGGLWHGAQWTFAIWGIYHACLLMIYHGLKTTWDRWPKILQQGITFLAVMFGWTFFRAPTLQSAFDWQRAILNFSTLSLPAVDLLTGLVILLCLIALGIEFFLPPASRMNLGCVSPRYQMLLGVLTFLALLSLNYHSSFLYYQF